MNGDSSRSVSLPELTGVVIHWHAEEDLAALVAAWPPDSRFELLVVDNGSRAPLRATGARVLEPGRNLGFAGGANLGIAAAQAPLVLLLNPDAHPEPGALQALIGGFAAYPDTAGLAPRLLGTDGRPQHEWQLRRLPSTAQLLGHALMIPGRSHLPHEPPAGTIVEQPAAAALALRKSALALMGPAPFDESFHPAWFEDVDLARRLAAAGARLRYWPQAVFTHRLGGSVPVLGYGGFLLAYYSNLNRYLRKHHAGAAYALRLLLPLGALLRLGLLPLRRPRRARSRAEAARALISLAVAGTLGFPSHGPMAPPMLSGGHDPPAPKSSG